MAAEDARTHAHHAVALLAWRWRSLDRRARGGGLSPAEIAAEMAALRPIAAAMAALAVVAFGPRHPRLPAGRQVPRG